MKGITEDIDAYWNVIKNFPVLSQEKEIQLFTEAKNGDDKAKKKIIECNLRLVLKIARQYFKIYPTASFSDMIQSGNIGVLKAVEKFDPSKGFKFSTYATYWIKGEIRSYLQDRGLIKITDYMHKKIERLKKVKKELQEQLQREPTLEEISSKMKVNIDEVRILYQFQFYIISWEGLLEEIPSTSNSEFIEKMQDKKFKTMLEEIIPDEQERLEQKEEIFFDKENARKLLEQLSPKEMKVLDMMLGLGLNDDQPQSKAQIRRVLGLSRARICQLSKEVISKVERMVKHNRVKK